ncbi:maleylpyruvate isomerase N-terminal domain-containing protein [Actinomadura roseirufa]|uniref:maleylpyruvate isomerase N-terminal domain-containing protein n=1 Tax=Actinomadura roseirufa TaxID=2094049 RepID=UPI00104121F5|nr:maleylpyruvate isomerase N-terminal domain-containing protein [Actinomadura roseirufa]
MGTRDDFLAAARVAAALLREPAVAEAWDGPSALPEFSVGGLAGHLGFQIAGLAALLAEPPGDEEPVSLLDHYGRSSWLGAGPDAEINVRIRGGGERAAQGGPEALAARVDAALAELSAGLPAAAERPVPLRLWGAWSLMLDDLLVTRMLELVVHADDLAVSAGVPEPVFPDEAVATVVGLLARLAVRRHGPVAVVRALSRAERAPATIAAL